MKLEEQAEKRQIILELFDKKIVFSVDDTAVGVCENIRSEAKEMLDNIERIEDKRVLEFVSDFLKSSLEKIMGEENIMVLENACDMTVPELTGILCYAISEIGREFSDVKENLDE